MALSTEEAAVNTAAVAYIAAIEALYTALSYGDTVQFVPANIGNADAYNHERSGDDTAVTTDFSIRHTDTAFGDSEFPIQIPAGTNGSLVPLIWFVTNQANDLT